MKVKVLGIDDALAKVTKFEGSVEEKRKAMFEAIYSENEVIDKIEYKGGTYFVVKDAVQK